MNVTNTQEIRKKAPTKATTLKTTHTKQTNNQPHTKMQTTQNPKTPTFFYSSFIFSEKLSIPSFAITPTHRKIIRLKSLTNSSFDGGMEERKVRRTGNKSSCVILTFKSKFLFNCGRPLADYYQVTGNCIYVTSNLRCLVQEKSTRLRL